MDAIAPGPHPSLMVKKSSPKSQPPPKAWKPLKIAAWLEFLGKSQTWLADQTGYSEPYISLLAAGRKRHNQDVEEAFEKALGLDPGSLRREPSTDDIWSIWQTLTPDQKKHATRIIKAYKGD